MKKNLLIIPGFGESTKEEPYQKLIRKYKNDFNIIKHNSVWNYNTASVWLSDLKQALEKIDVQNTVVISFSLGAYITLLAAESFRFKKVLLCSVSPFFKEQLSHMPQSAEKFFGKRRMKDFALHNIPKSLKCPAIFMFGSDDWPLAISEAKKLSYKYSVNFELIPNTHHELTDTYLEKIELFIK